MEYKSLADMGKTITNNLYKIPKDVDLIVGIPRSGLLAGNLLALALNTPLVDLDGFIENRKPRHGFTRKTKTDIKVPRNSKHVLIVDDTILSGKSITRIKEIITNASIKQKITYCTVYADPRSQDQVDIFLEEVTSPRSFEWNIMHIPLIEQCCVDIDGVLCLDPTHKENDDGEAYLDFLKNAKPRSLPTHKVGYLVTTRLEKYRKETEAWLKKYNIQYKKLHMLDLPDAETRRRLQPYGRFKAQVYNSYPDAPLFIESEPHQALEITKQTGRPVLCFSDQKLYTPSFSKAYVGVQVKSYHLRALNKAKRISKRMRKYFISNRSEKAVMMDSQHTNGDMNIGTKVLLTEKQKTQKDYI